MAAIEACEPPRVGVVVLNWNRPLYTIACLRSLSAIPYPPCELVVVDNGSIDDSVDHIRSRFPSVTLIALPENFGFAAGNNVGIRHLLRRGADYVFLVNDDAEVAPDALLHLIEAAESDPRIGFAGPKIYYFGSDNVIWFAGGSVDRVGQPSHRRANERDTGESAAVEDVDYVTGCALLVKRSVLEHVGFLDERFFAYFEETEWCARARRAGFQSVYVPQAHVWHKIEMSARTRSRTYLYLMARNRLLYLRCCGAEPWRIAQAYLSVLRTALSWAIKPRYRDMRPYSRALVRGVADFTIGRFGAPPAQI